jgi:flagellar biosynthesis component FlhA
MPFFDHVFGNLRGSGIVYLVCVAAIVGAFKFLGDHPRQKKFTLLGAILILAAGIGGGLIQAILFQVIVGTATPTFTPTATTSMDQVKVNLDQIKRQTDALATWGVISGIVSFVTGVAYAAGLACLVWAVFVDKVEGATRRKKAKPAKRRKEEDDDEDDEGDEDDRPKKKRAAKEEDDEDEEEDDRPRRRGKA